MGHHDSLAALNYLTGEVLGQCMKRHRHQEFLRFLKHADKHTEVGKDVHVLLDNYATHKHPAVLASAETELDEEKPGGPVPNWYGPGLMGVHGGPTAIADARGALSPGVSLGGAF